MWKSLVCAVALAGAAIGCASTGASPLLTADPTGTALFEQGQDALADQEWRDAVNAFDTLLRNYPSSPYLAEARLGLGQAYYEQGRVDTLILAIDAFQAFLTYHPSNQYVDYAQYMVAMTYIAQMRTPDRDQTPTRQAIAALDVFLENYPDSRLYPSAVAQRQMAIDSLAQHEYEVARWQAGRDEDWDAAVDRVQFALESYPDTTMKCELVFVLAEAYKQGKQNENAITNYRKVVDDYPDCEFAEEAQERIRDLSGS
jgi:outer membrane protein assembly factor BamD